jgi:hypothetical protein
MDSNGAGFERCEALESCPVKGLKCAQRCLRQKKVRKDPQGRVYKDAQSRVSKGTQGNKGADVNGAPDSREDLPTNERR